MNFNIFCSVVILCCLALGQGLPTARPIPVVEVLAVVEDRAWQKWQEEAGDDYLAMDELRSIFVEINEIFKTLSQHEVHIEIRLSDVVFTPPDSIGSTQISGNQCLVGFQHWMSGQNYKFDHAILFVSGDDQDSKISGSTYVGSTCNKYALSVARLEMDYGTAITAARLLAQSMKVLNDGNNNDCSPNEGYIMTPYIGPTAKNKWFFSRCSADQLRNYLAQEHLTCLNTTTAPQLHEGERFGIYVDGDEACRRAGFLFVARSAYKTYGDELCKNLLCYYKTEKDEIKYTYIDTPEGIICANEKMCVRGKCVESEYAQGARADDSCPLGDSPQTLFDNFNTCHEMVVQHGDNCKLDFYYQLCCRSCAKHNF